MSRFLFGAGLLILLLLAGLLGGCLMEDHHAPIAQALDDAAALVLSGEEDAAAALIHSTRQIWDARWRATAALTDHAPMDEIDSLFSQAEAYAAAGSLEELAACCARLSQLVRANGEAHKLTWWNLL